MVNFWLFIRCIWLGFGKVCLLYCGVVTVFFGFKIVVFGDCIAWIFIGVLEGDLIVEILLKVVLFVWVLRCNGFLLFCLYEFVSFVFIEGK